jgi:hypothetical protein
MSEYLDQLVRALQAEAVEERAALDRIRAKGLREPKDAGGQLRRTLQRLEILKSLRASEAAKSRTHARTLGRTARRAAGVHRGSEMKARSGGASSPLS